MKKFVHHALLVPLLIVLSACAGDKFPFPPQFVDANEISMRTLPPPPAQYSDTYKIEIQGILERQAKLSAVDKAKLHQEDHITPSMMVTPVLGEEYTEARYPQLYMLLRHAASDAWRIGDYSQEYWNRTRPWVADSRVQLLVPSIKRPSYPSGHSTTNHTWAHVLSDLFPEHSDAFFARALAIGEHRVDGGVHFPSDVMAGKKLAAFIYAKMRTSPQYQQELATARTELGLPDPIEASPH